MSGAFFANTGNNYSGNTQTGGNIVDFSAQRSNSIYGTSDTVQPPALTLLPCIKAFDAAVNPGLVDITELANDVAEMAHGIRLKANANLSNITRIPITYVPSGTIPVGGVLIINDQNSGSIHVPDYGVWYGHIMRYTADSANSGSIGVTYQAGIWPPGTLVIDIPKPGAYRAEHVYFSAIRIS